MSHPFELDPLLVVPEVHEPLLWPASVPRRKWSDQLRTSYPYRGFTPRPWEEAVLRLWLQGAPVDGLRPPPRVPDGDISPLPDSPLQTWSQNVDGALPGGAALVTGLRGVGKTTLVRKVLYDVAVAARHGLRLGPYEPLPDALSTLRRASDGTLQPGPSNRRLYVPVRLDVPTAISPASLLRRLLRRTYLALAAHQVGDLDPHLMRRARTAWVRSLGEVKESLSSTLSEQVGLSTDLLTKLEVTATQELEFARSLEVVAQQLTVEDAEDELVDLGRALGQGPSGRVEPVAHSTWSAIVEGARRFVAGVRRVGGDPGVQVILVVLVDELDKLPTTRVAQPTPALDTAQEVLMRLKTVLTAEGLLAVAIAGHDTEWRWNQERFALDANLRSLFSRHVYLPGLARPQVASFVKGHRRALWGTLAQQEKKRLVDAACFASRGRYKDLLRWAGQIRSDEVSELTTALGKVLGSWSSLSLQDGRDTLRTAARQHFEHLIALRRQAASPDEAAQLEAQLQALRERPQEVLHVRAVHKAAFQACSTLEQIAVTMAATFRGTVTPQFAIDLSRGAVLAQAELTLTHAGSMDADDAQTLQQTLYLEAGRLVPRTAVVTAMMRVSELVGHVVRVDLLADVLGQAD